MHDRESGCYYCGNPNVEEHHVIYGTANRKLSEKYGLKVYLCPECHRGNTGIHFDRKLDTGLKIEAQRAFQETYPQLDFVKIFGRSYL